MCIRCYREAGSPRIVSDKTKRAAELVKKVYEHSCVGGNAHVVLDDWNLDDDNIRWCLYTEIKRNSLRLSHENLKTEREALELFLSMTMDERASALAIHDGFLFI